MIGTVPKHSGPGYYHGIHHSDYMEALKALLLAGSYNGAKELLHPLLEVIEAEDRMEQLGVDFWHYEQLADIYHREGNYADELALLERYARWPRSIPDLVVERIARVQAALGQHT